MNPRSSSYIGDSVPLTSTVGFGTLSLISGQIGKLLNISVRDGFVNSVADVPAKEVLALLVGA